MTATAPAGEVRPEVVTAGRFRAGKSAAGTLVTGETGRRFDVGQKPREKALPCASKGIKQKQMNPTQKQFSLNRGASRKQFPISNLMNEAMNASRRGFHAARMWAPALVILAGLTLAEVAPAVAQPVLSSGPTESRVDSQQRSFATNAFVRSLRVSSNLPPYRFVLKPDTSSDEGNPSSDAIIGQVEIFRGNSQVLWQRLMVPGIHSSWLTNSFHSVDVDIDGFPDIAVLYEVAAKWGSHSFWLFEPASGRFVTNALTAALREVRHNGLTFDPAKKELRASQFIGICLNSFEVYRIEHGRLVLQESEMHEPRDPGRCLVTIRRRVNGELVLIESKEREHAFPPDL